MTGWNKKRKAMHHYDQVAAVYDFQYSEEQEAKMHAALCNLVLRPADLALDMGCGTGLLFSHIARNVEMVVGVDISRGILKRAKARTRQHSNVAIVRADVDFAPFPGGIFDMVFALTLLQNLPEPLLTLREMKRVSRLEAPIVVTGLKKTFSRSRFVQLLEQATLRIDVIKASQPLKGHVAVCSKPAR